LEDYALGDSYLLPRVEESTINDIFLQLKKGLSIDPFGIIESLKQITPFQQEIQEKQIVCTKDQINILDDLTFENLKATNCSNNFKLKAKAFKTALGSPTEQTPPFNFFIQLCGNLANIVRQSEELLDWVDADAHKNFHISKQKQGSQPSALTKLSQSKSFLTVLSTETY
jgi:hypothetical protein